MIQIWNLTQLIQSMKLKGEGSYGRLGVVPSTDVDGCYVVFYRPREENPLPGLQTENTKTPKKTYSLMTLR